MINFKAERQEEEFPKLDRRLQFIVYAIAGFMEQEFSIDAVVTDVYREDKGSVHHYWRGVDLRTRHLTEAEGDSVVEFVNEVAIYNYTGKKVLVDERIKMSSKASSQHFHLQVDSSGKTGLRAQL